MIKPLRREAFRTPVLREAPARGVDRNRNIIYGVKLIEKGPLNDADVRPYEVDDETLDNVVELAGRHKQGLRSRFTHPDLSNDGLGSHLGRIREVERSGDAVYGNIYLAEASFDSPRGDLGHYVMDLAEEDSAAFGMSLATAIDDEAMSVLEGDETRESELIPLRFKSIHAGDVVDSPAATRGGMFDAWDIPDERSLPAMAEWVMERFFKDLTLEQTRERLESYLRKFYNRKQSDLGDSSMSETTVVIEDTQEVQEVVSEQEEQTEATETATVEDSATETPQEEATTETEESTQETPPAVDLSVGRQYIELFGDRGATWFIEGKSLTECYSLQIADMRQQIEQLTADNQALSTRLEAALAAAGESEVLSAQPVNTESQQKAALIQQKINDARRKGVPERAAKLALT